MTPLRPPRYDTSEPRRGRVTWRVAGTGEHGCAPRGSRHPLGFQLTLHLRQGVDGASSVEQDTVAVTVHELSTSSQPQPKGLLAFDPLGKTGAQQVRLEGVGERRV
jgi:hypothetical protein